MRNLRKYPVTTQEKVEALLWALETYEELNPDTCGDITPVALEELRQEMMARDLEEL